MTKETLHSPFGASSAKRWLTCPGSIQAIKKAPKPPPSVFAAEGTAAHELAEVCLINKVDANHYLGETFNDFEVTEEMCEAVQVYLDYVLAAWGKGTESTLYIETKFHLVDWHYLLFGTNDACIIDKKNKTIHIIDYKHGQGVSVDVEDNEQLKYYALGALEELEGDFEHVVLTIVQPRAPHPDGPIRTWETTPEHLREFGKHLVYGIDTAQHTDALLSAGSHCKFCPALPTCPAVKQHTQEIAQIEFKDDPVVNLPNASDLEETQLAKILVSSDLIREWLASVETYAKLISERGQKIPGYKLVQKRAHRKFSDPDKVVRVLASMLDQEAYEEMFTDPTLRSPAQVLKKLKGLDEDKSELEELIVVPDSGLVLVPEKDPRGAVDQYQVDFID